MLCNCVFKLEKKLLKIKKKIDSVESLTTLSMTPRCQWHRCVCLIPRGVHNNTKLDTVVSMKLKNLMTLSL